MGAGLSIHGTVEPGFEPVETAFADNFLRRGEIGAAVSVVWRGRRVVDLWGGRAERSSGRPWQRDTVAVLFSSTKGLAALCLLMLADRGQLDYDAPVAAYWPSFARRGKGRITVRDLLNHRSGVCAIDEPLGIEDFDGSDRVARALEAQAPLWTPGTAQGYHGVSFGALVAELFKRVAGRSIGSFLADEVARPLDADVYIGLPEDVRPRLARLYPLRRRDRISKILPEVFRRRTTEGRVYRAYLRRRTPTARASANPVDLGPTGVHNFNDPRVHRLELPWANGIGSARGLATVYGALAQGGSWNGVTLVRPETLEPLHRRQSWGMDRVLCKQMGFSQGFVKEELHLFSPHIEAFGHPGAGGALGLADPKAGLGIGYVMNRMDHRLRSPRALALCHATYEALGRLGEPVTPGVEPPRSAPRTRRGSATPPARA